MLIIQHIWSRWTKQARGANSPLQRPRLAEACLLPAAEGRAEVLRHEVRALEREEFEMIERIGPIDRDGWERSTPMHAANLRWRLRGEGVEVSLRPPWEGMRQTRWPAHLPSPLFVLTPGETARIDWNARFRASLFGSNRSSFYEQHIFRLANVAAIEPRLFLDSVPRKTIDLRTSIY